MFKKHQSELKVYAMQTFSSTIDMRFVSSSFPMLLLIMVINIITTALFIMLVTASYINHK